MHEASGYIQIYVYCVCAIVLIMHDTVVVFKDLQTLERYSVL